jgi:low molecular weight protein-tyrosine phosphatase
MSSKRRSVLFVCLGNICRSPLAEGVLLHHLSEEGLLESVEVDSAGTGAWHVGERPDGRSLEVAHRHGIELPGHARRVCAQDFNDFDYIYAMDCENLNGLQRMREASGGVTLGNAVLELFRANDPEAGPDADVPDPYYGGPGGFDSVFDMVDRTCRVIVEKLAEALEQE